MDPKQHYLITLWLWRDRAILVLRQTTWFWNTQDRLEAVRYALEALNQEIRRVRA